MLNDNQNLDTAMAKFAGAVPENDLLHMFAPLMRQMAELHQQGKVAKVHPTNISVAKDGSLALVNPQGFAIQANHLGLLSIQHQSDSALNIVSDISVTNDAGVGYSVEDLQVLKQQASSKIDKPVYLNGYQSWESKLKHHDELTDVFCLGLIIAACACHLDLNDDNDLQIFSLNRTNLYRINSRIHPAIAALIEGMTHLNRHDRDSDIKALALRLENYREQQGRFNAEQLLDNVREIPQRRSAILSNLRDRLFDLSKRNRLIHFKASQASVNLTVASVPLVMRLESIRKEQLCTWNSHFEKSILSGKAQPLGQWLRFEDQSYLPSALDRLISQSRRDKAEYGFSSLRLVIGFLNWYNLKDGSSEKITSPLLWINVEVKKKKGVRDLYLIENLEPIAEFNPALRHYLKQLYDIDLPEQIDLTDTSIEHVHQQLAQQIAKTEPDVKLDLTSQPAVRLIHQRAVKRLRKFEKRKTRRTQRRSALAKFSYDKNDYKPLGRTIFEDYVLLSALPQRSALGQAVESRPAFMSGQGSTAEAQTYTLDKADTSKYSWDIDLADVTLTNFNYKKMSLVRDYSSLIEGSESLDSLDRLFSIKPRQDDPEPVNGLSVDQQWNVVPSDITQDQAVALARKGGSFIIQGPPGTGKSQTITNLIADFAARGKRVLFVCEKRAALDVVFNRLKLAGLDSLACIIHDIQEDKKPFIHDLKAVYQDWFESQPESERLQALRRRSLQAFGENFDKIEMLERYLGECSEQETETIRVLIRRELALEPLVNEYSEIVREQLPTPSNWDKEIRLAKRIELSMAENFELESLAESVFSSLKEDTVVNENPFNYVSQFTQQAEQISDQLSDLVDMLGDVLEQDDTLSDLKSLAEHASKMVAFKLHDLLSLFEPKSDLSLRLASDLERLRKQREVVQVRTASSAQWHTPFSLEDTQNALALAREKESAFLSFLSSPWRSLKKTVEQQYNFSAHAVRPSVTNVLEKLLEQYAAQAKEAEIEAGISEYLNCDSVRALVTLVEEISIIMATTPSLKRLIAAPEARESILALTNNLHNMNALEGLLHSHMIPQLESPSFAQVQESIRDMRESLDDLPVILPLLKASYQVDSRVGFVLRNVSASVAQMEALVVDQALASALRSRPELSSYDTAKLADYSKRAAMAKQILHTQNAEQIVASRHEHFKLHLRTSNMSATQLDAQQLAFKKYYSTGRREVEHEFGKTMRYRSIRDMASDETGAVVSDLKPIWLMSPLSVSDTLPMDPNLFDVVIFDEASQIPVEDGIPALCRAPQLIVVGDEMQLPPTSFFATSIEDEDVEIEAQEEGEVVSVLLDADSLLSQAARQLPATLLAWHYRSRSESLISFSNAAFYDGKLVTIPDQTPAKNASAAAPDQSEQLDTLSDTSLSGDFEEQSAQVDSIETNGEEIASVTQLLANPVSFHLVEDSVYERRENQGEANLIASMVRKLLVDESEQSIGIVAFSEAQKNCIEEAFDKLADEDSHFAGLLEQAYTREDDGQFNGLFVKNLENVQGDERDIIILSICYGPGPSGKMLMNFGPINQRGGEKRLNVIFSRARSHMAVVSSIRANAITNTHNEGAFALRAFLAFAEAQDQGDPEAARVALSSVNPSALDIFSANPPDDSLRKNIAQALVAKGYEVREFVGSARFRCDIAIIDKHTGEFALGILLDHRLKETSGHRFERYVFKPNILRSFGWRVIDIPSLVWHQSSKSVLAHIEYILSDPQSEQPMSEQELFDNISIPSFNLPPADTHVASSAESAPSSSSSSSTLDFKHFHFKQGKSDKFWRIAQDNLDVIVHYGRSGTKGQKVIKNYDSDTRAKREMNKLILEKTKKGYQEQ